MMKQLTLLVALASLGLSTGDLARDFEKKNQNGKRIHLSDFRGKFVLLYFYPKDDTPGCTKEACAFRDSFSLLQKNQIVVIGVSRQDEQSHKDFSTKYKLPFDLIADLDGRLAQVYGIDTIPVVGLFKRQSVLVAPNGIVARIYKDVDAELHAKQVLADISAIRSK